MTTTGYLTKEYVTRKFYEYGYGVEYMKSNDTYHCSCPICMEGKSFGKKKRCWYIPAKDLIYCHNCGWSSKPLKWIMTVGNLSMDDIKKELLDGEYTIINLDKKPVTDFSDLIDDGIQDSLPYNSIDLSNSLQLDYYKSNPIIDKVQRYIKNRRLSEAINKPKSFYVSLKDKTHKNRLIIPFYDINDKIIFYQSRAIGANMDNFMEDIKYLSKKNSLKSVFNINKIDDNLKEIFIFEGPIDACFIKNGVAVGGITPSREQSLTEIQEEQLNFYADSHEFIWVLDSQWLDDAAYKKTQILLKNRRTSVYMARIYW